MATKRAPKESSISRTRTVAYARKQRPAGEGDAPDEDAPEVEGAKEKSEPKAEAKAETKAEPKPEAKAEAKEAKPVEPKATPEKSAELPTLIEPDLVRTQTVTMPPQTSIGAPPAMPKDAAKPAPPSDVHAAESPTHMPGPREIPPGNPDDPARPPGVVPSGDSRSLRRRADRYEFALVYRIQTYVISRVGVVGTRGQWRVVEYPTSAAASHSYAKECSRFAGDGFSDYRE